MTTIRFPFQKLCSVSPLGGDKGRYLYAACGPDILTLDLSSGHVAAQWSTRHDSEGWVEEDSSHPNKRRKVEHEQNGSQSCQESEQSVEFKVERLKGERKKAKVEQSKAANFSHLVATSDGQSLISVTADDKTIRVFSIDADSGRLVVKSSRSMPKRICAVVLDPTETTIVVGDKFGDVYSLPLHPSKDYVRPKPKPAPQTFQPSASELTVHTKRNLEALRHQREQKKKVSARNEGPEFEHQLLLGHVSLLTDVLVATSVVEQKKRAFTLTSDRDEHIRVSRYPQGHVIEGYCLGHRDFVSRMCIPEWRAEYLISGGGEPSLKVFDWRKGVLVSEAKLDDDRIKTAVTKALTSNTDGRTFNKLAISGIWAITVEAASGRVATATEEKPGFILAAFEGLPLLLSFSLDTNGLLELHQIIESNSNVLDVASPAGRDLILVSLDTAHEKASTKSFKAERSNSNEWLEAFELESTTNGYGWVWKRADLVRPLNAAIAGVEDHPQVVEASADAKSERQRGKGEYSGLGEFLYGLENLRKKRGYATAEDEGEENEEAAAAE